jgi:hypothetical protein
MQVGRIIKIAVAVLITLFVSMSLINAFFIEGISQAGGAAAITAVVAFCGIALCDAWLLLSSALDRSRLHMPVRLYTGLFVSTLLPANVTYMISIYLGNPRHLAEGLAIAAAFGVPGIVAMTFLVYQMWAAMQDAPGAIPPGKAVGFLFIPLFNIYWVFRAIWGWPAVYNAWRVQQGLDLPAVPSAPFLVLILAGMATAIPVIGPAVGVGSALLFIYLVNRICRAINALPLRGMPRQTEALRA